MPEFTITSDGFEKYTSQQELEALLAKLDSLRTGIEIYDWQGTPNIEYHFYFSGHSQEADFVGLQDAIRDADVVIPEIPGWTHNSLVDLRKVAKGKSYARKSQRAAGVLSVEDTKRIFGDRESLESALFDTRKRVEAIDLPYDKAAELHAKMSRALMFRFDEFDNLDDMIAHFAYGKALEAKFQLSREAHMMESLERLFSQETNPLKALIMLGADHTFIARQLQRKGELVRRTFYPKPLVYTYRDELSRRLIYGKEFDKDLVLKAMVEGSLVLAGGNIFEGAANTVEAGWAGRLAIDQYSKEQLKDFVSSKLKPKTE